MPNLGKPFKLLIALAMMLGLCSQAYGAGPVTVESAESVNAGNWEVEASATMTDVYEVKYFRVKFDVNKK